MHVRSARDLGPVAIQNLRLLVSGSLLSRIPPSLSGTCGCLKTWSSGSSVKKDGRCSIYILAGSPSTDWNLPSDWKL